MAPHIEGLSSTGVIVTEHLRSLSPQATERQKDLLGVEKIVPYFRVDLKSPEAFDPELFDKYVTEVSGTHDPRFSKDAGFVVSDGFLLVHAPMRLPQGIMNLLSGEGYSTNVDSGGLIRVHAVPPPDLKPRTMWGFQHVLTEFTGLSINASDEYRDTQLKPILGEYFNFLENMPYL